MTEQRKHDWLIRYDEADARLERVKAGADKLEVSETIKDVWRAACDCCIAQLTLVTPHFLPYDEAGYELIPPQMVVKAKEAEA